MKSLDKINAPGVGAWSSVDLEVDDDNSVFYADFERSDQAFSCSSANLWVDLASIPTTSTAAGFARQLYRAIEAMV